MRAAAAGLLLVAALAAGGGEPSPKTKERQLEASLPHEQVMLLKEAPALPGDLWQQQASAPHGEKDWLVYGGNHRAWRYSSLNQINKQNVSKLKVAWLLPTGLHDAFETTPIVVNGVMYFSTAWNNVYAVDARSGEIYWQYMHPLPKSLPLCCGAVNRGVAVGAGKVFLATLDARVLALDARTGQKVWDSLRASIEEGYSLTVAPVVIKDKVIVGSSGSDFGTRGFIDALDINTGKQVWRWWAVPGPGEPGHETWKGDGWIHGGGSAWMPVTYDAESNLIFAGIGNPGPDLDGDPRPGDNLYTECTVALDADSGKTRWHFQMIPHDVWDLDNVTETVIDDITIEGKKSRVGMVASKNGFFYVLDLKTGKCLYALQYVHKVNWGKVDPDGTPHPDPKMFPVKDSYKVVYPGASGGKEWCPVAYDPQRKRIFVPVIENAHMHRVERQKFIGGLNYWGGVSVSVPGEGYGHLCAIDVEKKQIAWDKRTKYPLVCGVACTAGDIVVTGTPDLRMQAYDSDSGEVLFEWRGPSGWHSAPMFYEVDGVQYLGFANGWGGWVAGFDADGAPELSSLPKNNVMCAFALGDKLGPPPSHLPAYRPKEEPAALMDTHMAPGGAANQPPARPNN